MALTVNGHAVEKPKQLNNISLLAFIRDYLGMTGTKYGCGKGLCGACTVHINGNAVRSCQIPLKSLEGVTITTIEGLAASASDKSKSDGENNLHPLQQAWIAESVPQCGYCQAGQIMSAAAFLSKQPNPSVDEIKTAMNGNLCRCGTYLRIQKAILRAAAEMGNG